MPRFMECLRIGPQKAREAAPNPFGRDHTHRHRAFLELSTGQFNSGSSSAMPANPDSNPSTNDPPVNGPTAGLDNGPGEDMGLLTEFLSDNPNRPVPSSAAALGSLEADIASLKDFLTAECDKDPADGSELKVLLAQLESAHGVASDVESRLDGMLATLDDLLTHLDGHPSKTHRPVDPSSAKS
ncbi:hypothetical protein ID866_7596 [Astraeus odoratus]|nr:hypothetical protein ID866_7596 [Astraeus odoratus]